MMRPLALRTAVLVLALPLAVAAQTFDLGADATPYQRFLVYPHLQKGWESMERGDRDRALAEFTRARELAPDNAITALHLAGAYRRFGLRDREEAVLREQLALTPSDARLRAALAELRPASPARAPSTGEVETRPAPPPQPPTQAPAGRRPATLQREPSGPPASAANAESNPAAAGPLSPAVDDRTRFALAVEAGRFDEARTHAVSLLQQDGSHALLDELTYRLAVRNAQDQAAALLLDAYPFAGGTPDERSRLLMRLTTLLPRPDDGTLEPAAARLREPLDSPALRGHQSVFWAGRGDCAAVRGLLGDLSPEYGHDDLVRLGDCSRTEAPALALEAYALAHARAPGGVGTRALAYQAHAAGQASTALAAWRAVGTTGMSAEELIAGAATALDAKDRAQAAAWLDAYRERGGTPGHRYWWLLSEAHWGADSTRAASALARALEIEPDAGGYVRLARLQADPVQALGSLERAARLDPDDGAIQKELAVAYARAGREADAWRARERASVLDPADTTLHMELGYAFWRDGRIAEAGLAFERAWAAEKNVLAAEQLVYVYQRLERNTQSRAYAERVLDARAPGARAPAGNASPERVFGLRRLHEDLGRRLTFGWDGWSGTHAGTGNSALEPARVSSSYTQFEVDYRLGRQPIRNGTTLSAYARLMADGGPERGALPARNAILGAGIRWKPLRSRVFLVSGELQTGLQDEDDRDLLLRASASFLNEGRRGDDWHPSGQGWFAHNLYVDAAHYVDAARTGLTADYRAGYHGKVTDNQTMEPYGHLQANGLRTSAWERDLRAGVGIRWNLWYGASRYDAPRHKLSLGVEFQQALDTYLANTRGVFFALGSRW